MLPAIQYRMNTLKQSLSIVIKDHIDSLKDGDFKTAIDCLNTIEALMVVILKFKTYKVK